MSKYDDWIAKQKIPARVSLLELSVLGMKLGIDVEKITNKYVTLEFNLLLKACQEALAERQVK